MTYDALMDILASFSYFDDIAILHDGRVLSDTHGGKLCIISFHRICKEHVSTVLMGLSSTEMMQDCPLHV